MKSYTPVKCADVNGHLIAIEGPDGCGTTLHTRLLTEKLEKKGMPVLSTFEPTDGPIGTKIREKLHSGEDFDPLVLQKLFVEDRAWHIEYVINPALAEGKIVITDRYFHSTICYGQALGMPKDELKALNKDFIQPDLLFLLLPPYTLCAERMGRREKHDALEEDNVQKRVYAFYQQMAVELPEAHVIDTSGEKEEVAEEILYIVRSSL